jgi:hypothetical protein
MAVFLNPAGLAGIKKGALHFAVMDYTASSDIVGAVGEARAAFKSLSGEALNVFVGKNIFVQGQASPTILFPGFGIAGFSDTQFGLNMQNSALPETSLLYQNTNGVQFAYGTTLGKKRSGSKSEFRIGAAGKLMYRRGGVQKMSALTLVQSTAPQIKERIGNHGKGYGLDLGTQYVRVLGPRLTWSMGATLLDLGDTNFGNGPDPMKSNLSAGTAATFNLGLIRAIGSFELKNLLDTTDFRKKTHLGVELKLPIVSAMLGINQVYYTYGLAVDLWVLKLTGASYGEELGSYAFQDPDRRYMVRLDLSLSF